MGDADALRYEPCPRCDPSTFGQGPAPRDCPVCHGQGFVVKGAAPLK